VINVFIDKKLKHYYVTGVLIEPGQFVDRFGRAVEFTSYDQFESDDVVPIYYEHGGAIVGFATRFYTSNGKLRFDGYVFDPHIMQALMSSNPGVSAELIKTNNGWVITGIALTKHPAIENAGVYGVIAMSSIKKELQQFLEDNGIETYFQATTRSPVNVDGAIKSKLQFKDNYFENIDNFLYNVIDKEYDKIFICYETTKLPTNFNLKSQLKKFNVEELFFNV